MQIFLPLLCHFSFLFLLFAFQRDLFVIWILAFGLCSYKIPQKYQASEGFPIFQRLMI